MIAITNIHVNGVEGVSPTDAGLSIIKDTPLTDNQASSILLKSSAFGLPLVTTEDDRYEPDKTIAYSITGDFSVSVDGEVDKGTFTATVPANFPEDEFRTNDKWTSTK
jgi:hypothetical protein